MSNINSLLEGVQSAYAKLAEVELVAQRYPGDKFVLASIGSLKAHAAQLEEQWLEECRDQQIEVCRYRLLKRDGIAYSATALAKSLLDFQELIAQLFDAKINGPKQRARVTGEVLTETAFNLAYTFPGSLGIVLTVQDRPDLFGGRFDETVEAFQQITTIEDENDVRDMAKTLGDAVVKKIFDWSTANYDAGYSVDVTWTGRLGVHSGGLVPRDRLGRLIDVISRTSDKEQRRMRVRGSLVMIDVGRERFRFVVSEGPDIPGVLGSEFDLHRQWAVNRTYTADILVEAVTHYATQRTDQTYTLEKLQEDEKYA